MKKALITGSSGFTGKVLRNRLAQKGYSTTGFDIVRGDGNQDIRNKDAVDLAVKDHDVVFNLAGILGTHELIEGNIREAVEINVLGTINVLEAARKYNVDVVEIGKPNLWLNTYSITKKAAEDFSLMYATEHGVKVWIVRWYNVFGPGQHYGSPQKLAPTSIVKALKGENIPVFGSGEQTADHIYVDDAVDAAIAIYELNDAMGFPVEVGHHHMTINKFVDTVLKITGSKSRIEHLPMRKGEAPMATVKANTEFLNKIVGFNPKRDFESGIKDTVAYYKAMVNAGQI